MLHHHPTLLHSTAHSHPRGWIDDVFKNERNTLSPHQCCYKNAPKFEGGKLQGSLPPEILCNRNTHHFQCGVLILQGTPGVYPKMLFPRYGSWGVIKRTSDRSLQKYLEIPSDIRNRTCAHVLTIFSQDLDLRRLNWNRSLPHRFSPLFLSPQKCTRRRKKGGRRARKAKRVAQNMDTTHGTRRRRTPSPNT